MEVLTHDEFTKLTTGNAYYDGRWAYLEKVGQIVTESKPQSVLELGPSFLTIVKDCDIMYLPDIDTWGIPEIINGKSYAHDARMIPWPIDDKYYDMFIALQVFEHLDGKQKQAFQEAKRIAKSIVLSLPYKWKCPKDNTHYYPSHHMIDENVIIDWADGEMPEKIIYIERTGERISKGERIICYWKF